jgi:hypothetical protein
VTREHNIAELLDDLEDAYRHVLNRWNEHRTVFDCENKPSPFLQWPDGTFTAEVQRDVSYRFHELVTTSRFSVNEMPNLYELHAFNPPSENVTLGHAASLAAMVCILEAIEALELIEDWWREDSETVRAGTSFDWLLKHDRNRLDMIISDVFAAPEEPEAYNQQITLAMDALDQANLWISHLTTIDCSAKEKKLSTRIDASRKATSLAKKPRKGKDLTDELLVAYFKKWRDTKQSKFIVSELAEKYELDERTIYRRHKKAKERNLLL